MKGVRFFVAGLPIFLLPCLVEIYLLYDGLHTSIRLADTVVFLSLRFGGFLLRK